MSNLVIGQPVPDFTLPRAGGGTLSLDDFKGSGLVLFFYPKADTPGCTREAVEFSAAEADFTACRTRLLGISQDPLSKQEKFIARHRLSVPIASDESLGMLEAYGVWVEKSMYGRHYMGIERTTLLIDQRGNLVRLWPKVKVNGHVAEVLAAARALDKTG